MTKQNKLKSRHTYYENPLSRESLQDVSLCCTVLSSHMRKPYTVHRWCSDSMDFGKRDVFVKTTTPCNCLGFTIAYYHVGCSAVGVNKMMQNYALCIYKRVRCEREVRQHYLHKVLRILLKEFQRIYPLLFFIIVSSFISFSQPY